MAKETKKPGVPSPAAPTIDFSQDQHAGFENVSQNDLGIPFLGIIQSNSPQFDRTKTKHAEKKIDGCQPGDIFNTLENVVLPRPVLFVPAGYQKLFVEWKPRETGGGMVAIHRDEAILASTTKDDRKRDRLKNGNLIATTAYFYGHALQASEWKQVVIGMTSTALRAARGWLNMMMALKMTGPSGKFTPPMFSHIYQLDTYLESKNENSWYTWKVSMQGLNNEPKLIDDSRSIAKMVATGKQLSLPNAASEEVSDTVPM